jgi:S-adenosylmethionine decarboxylase
MTQHLASGLHCLVDLYGVNADLLADPVRLEAILRQAAEAAKAHILFSHFHHFGAQQGVTGVLLLAESHISIHTWPEQGFAAADVFMCGNAEPERALDVLRNALTPEREQVQRITRGQP